MSFSDTEISSDTSLVAALEEFLESSEEMGGGRKYNPYVRNKGVYSATSDHNRIYFNRQIQYDTVRKGNLNKLEQTALKNLGKKNNIVVWTADKGGAIVILDSEGISMPTPPIEADCGRYRVNGGGFECLGTRAFAAFGGHLCGLY